MRRRGECVAGSPGEPPDHIRLDLDVYPFRCEVQTRFADLDPLRHINNVSMGLLFEEGRLQFNQLLFERVSRPERYTLVVVQVNYRFIAETFYPGAVAIGLGLGRIGRTSFTYHQGLFQHGRCTSLCDTTLVGLHDGGPAPIPDPMRRALEEFAPPKRQGEL